VVPKSIPRLGLELGTVEDMNGYYFAYGGIIPVSIEADLKTIAVQEEQLQFEAFSAETAWLLGCRLRADALARGAAMTFEIQIAGRTLFLAATDGAPAGQADWIRRKRNVVMRFGRSSYAIGLQLELEGKTIEQRHGLTLGRLRDAWGWVSDHAARDRSDWERDFERAASARRSRDGGRCSGWGDWG